MKAGIKALLTICLLIAQSAAIFASEGGGQFKVGTEKGILVAKNGRKPDPPAGAATKLILEEIYTAGGGNLPEESFVEPIAGDVAKDGTAYILDWKDNKVKVFDARGKFLRAFGKKGQGPGELNQPQGLIITPENEVLVVDGLNQRFAIFSLDGKFLRNISTAKALGIAGVKMDSRGLTVARSTDFGGDESKMSMSLGIKVYDKDLNVKTTLGTFEMPVSLQAKINPFSAVSLLYALDGQGHLYLGSQSGYEIKVLSLEGRPIRTIRRDYDPIRMSQADKDEMLKAFSVVPGVNIKDRIQFPEVYPPYTDFVPADEGRLLVMTYEKGKATKEFYWDVFDSDGRYIAKVPIVGQIRLWRDGKVYFFVENEEGFRVLKCCRARWEK
jgi:hypothetical protein